MIKTFRLTARGNYPRIGRYARKRQRQSEKESLPTGLRCVLRGASAAGERTACQLGVYREIRAVVDELSDDRLTFVCISAVRARLARSSRGT